MKKILFILLAILLSSTLPAQKSYTCNVFFITDKATLTSTELQKLQQFTDSINKNNIAKITVTAFCDERASNGYNERLSKRRADFVRKMLISSGCNSNNISVQGKGELPIAESTDIDQKRAYNRRAEITIVQKESPKNAVIPSDMKIGDKIVLENILFDFMQSILLPESNLTLDKLIADLKKNKKYHIIILGHVCCAPPGEDGFDRRSGKNNLSITRAKAVYDYLVDNGIDPKRLEYKGMKADYPTGKGKEFDKRVEIEIKDIVNE